LDLRGRKGWEAGGDCILRGLIIVRFTRYYYGDQIKEDEMDGTCSTHGRDGKCTNILTGKLN
jgi:hypothetical protein